MGTQLEEVSGKINERRLAFPGRFTMMPDPAGAGMACWDTAGCSGKSGAERAHVLHQTERRGRAHRIQRIHESHDADGPYSTVPLQQLPGGYGSPAVSTVRISLPPVKAKARSVRLPDVLQHDRRRAAA